MGRLPPAVARCRVAVRQALRPLVRGGQRPLVLVACSGGPDSLALAATASFVGPRLGLGVGLATVDHGLQPSSAQQAEKVAGWARDEGLVPVIVTAVTVAGYRGGPEAAARQARYAALAQAAAACSAAAVLLGHTQDDQAETVLLALARGGGLRGLAAMPPQPGGG